ncbi:hypothetical protein AYO44_05355 [Planctomycetaceae bacterium SCGC AG-212-F19]|nr:hypothetical protein AYO44_05355 [Planctomycetaceae bacterium SCGC AG-212-F19]
MSSIGENLDRGDLPNAVEPAPPPAAETAPPVQAPAPEAARPPVPRQVLINISLIALACLPWLVVHGMRLWAKPHYQFFPIVLVGACVLAWRGWKELGEVQPGQLGGGLAVVASAWLLLVLAGIPFSSLLATVATLILIAGLLYTVGGWAMLRAMLPAWLFLWLIIPLPMNLDNRLIGHLQTWTARGSSAVLDLFRVIHVTDGNVFEVPGKRLLVEEACSGIHSLYSILTCTLFYIFWSRYRIIRGTLLLLASVFWVLINNVTRVVVIVWLFTRWDIDVSTGWRHEVLGWVLFAITLGLVWSTDRLLMFFIQVRGHGSPAEENAMAAPRGAQILANAGSLWVGRWPVGVAFGALGVMQLALFAVAFTPAANAAIPAVAESLDGLKADTLPARIGPWQRTRFEVTQLKVLETLDGVQSRTWYYQSGSLMAVISLDHPFIEWHDLTICYRGQGWTIGPQVVRPRQPDDPEGGPFVEATMQKPLERHGYLLFGLMDRQGAHASPPGDALTDRPSTYAVLWARLNGRPLHVVSPTDRLYQTQLFIQAYTPLSAADLTQAQALYQQVRRTLAQALRAE